MRVLGQENVREYGVAVVETSGGDPLNIPIQAVGSEIERLFAHECWHAEPPVEVRRNKKGEIIRDQDGAPATFVNRESAKFKAQQAEVNTLFSVAYIYLGVRQGAEGFEWDTDPAGLNDNPRKFFRDIQQEMIDAGLSQGAQASLFRQIHEISVPTRREVEGAKQSFQGD